MKLLILTVLAFLCAAVAQQAPTIPDIPNDFSMVVEISHMQCPPQLGLNCPVTETFHEFRSYSMNAMKFVHSKFEQHLYFFDYDVGHHVVPFNCTTFNATTAAINHHGVFPLYDQTTNHVTTGAHMFFLDQPGIYYVGPKLVRGINANQFSGQVNVNIQPGMSANLQISWYFSVANWTFSSIDYTNSSQIPLRMEVNAIITDGPITYQYQETQDFSDFNPFVDPMDLFYPEETFCPMLIQQPIPTMPQSYSHTLEMNELDLNFTYTGRFYFDYTQNKLRMQRWENDANVISIIDVTNLQNWTFSWHQGCTQSQVTPGNNMPGHHNYLDHLIDFSTNPPHLFPMTEMVGGNSPTNWQFAGIRPVRDIMAQVWFSSTNYTNPGIPDISSAGEIVAWYFTAPGWNIVGLPQDVTVPIRCTRIGWFFNATTGAPFFMTSHREYSDVQLGLEPDVFDVPFFCPGGMPLPGQGDHGLSSGGAAGLAIGMIILGAILGIGCLYAYNRWRGAEFLSVESSRTANTEERINLRQSNYGSGL